VIAHGTGLFTCYLHMSKVLVNAGVVVEKGQSIGLIGMTGLATGPHLHFEVRDGATCANGFDLLGMKE
ncbi:MAG: M23 family metallopeptidase, partial [Spirochaetia bacterium]|nr:M23 family metallopeptidase [Spirochaetia bacterium]